ncbi:MAG: DUF308 domain-containing protein [Chloroflexota bacterium]|nr:DUF308 domain-containing protein [Chloroflexota bacterium]
MGEFSSRDASRSEAWEHLASRGLHSSWLLAIDGLISILFGIAAVVMPVAGALAIVWVIGTYAAFIGVVMVVVAFRLRTPPPVAVAVA